MNRVIHFEIIATDVARAVTFYGNVFRWRIDKVEEREYYLIKTGDGDGIDGAIMPRQMPFENTEGFRGYVCTIEVDSYDNYARKIKEAGGGQITDKKEISGVGIFGYFSDTEGNAFAIVEKPQ